MCLQRARAAHEAAAAACDLVWPSDVAELKDKLTALGEVAGTVSKGAAAAAIARLRATTYGALRPGGPGGDPREGEEQCAICRMEFEPEDALLVLPCGHHYHSACIRRWLEDQKTCPQCGAELEA